MKTQISTSDLAVFSNVNLEKAWYLLAVLMSIGRPVSPAELAGRCSIFSISPDFVEFVCSIPKSPIFLTRSKFVLPSMVALMAASEFFEVLMPKVDVALGCGRSLCGDKAKTCHRKRKIIASEIMPLVKKRAVLSCENGNDKENICALSRKETVVDLHSNQTVTTIDTPTFGPLTKVVNLKLFGNIISVPQLQQDCPFGKISTPTNKLKSNVRLLGYELNNEEESRGENKPALPKVVTLEEHSDIGKDDVTISAMLDFDRQKDTAPLHKSLAEISPLLEETRGESTTMINGIDTISTCIKPERQIQNTLVDASTIPNAIDSFGNATICEKRMKELIELPRIVSAPQEALSSWEENKPFPQDKLCLISVEGPSGRMPALKNGTRNTTEGRGTSMPSDKQFVTQKSPVKKSIAMKNVHQDKLINEKQIPSKFLQHGSGDIGIEKLKGLKDHSTSSIKLKSKSIVRSKTLLQEKCSTKDQQEPKSFPEFDSYIVEEEEGSGGYGIVYRARRKSDGVTFAIKCPRVNAHKHHVKNELKMLERFGGRSFVIKYEGSFKKGSSECFVLEHVEHDRPEVLRREINVFQLQWYGYCMFRALASLHKQGVFHRDVKPGNFLFSRKSNKGYLIDFNLAKDLHQKHENTDKSKTSYSTSHQHLQSGQSKSVSPNKKRKILDGKSTKLFNVAATNGSNLENNNLKRKSLDKLNAHGDFSRRNSMTSQGAEASGLTSAKDLAPSTEKLREPLPCQGRKELINLAQEAMQNPNMVATSAPSSKRKRVAASPGIIDKKFVHISPMPLYSPGIGVLGAGSAKNKDVKPHKEGPCAGTKGFRAPEVLLRSPHQGPKVDIWSAGVTLLYLITGRMAFSGEPEQNMKDIAKLKGNEELWEVAKLHDREASFPVDLLDIRYLSSTKLKDWCVTHTRRPDFIELIPNSLFDLVEKCLAVNPRTRITAEEALMHEFFSPCHEALRRQRSLRRGPYQDSRSNTTSTMDDVSTSKLARVTYEQSFSPVKLNMV